MSSPKISIAQAFDMIPMGGSMAFKIPEEDIMAEANRRNAMYSGEWYSVAIRLNVFGWPCGALVTRHERWDIARDTPLMGVVRFASRYIV